MSCFDGSTTPSRSWFDGGDAKRGWFARGERGGRMMARSSKSQEENQRSSHNCSRWRQKRWCIASAVSLAAMPAAGALAAAAAVSRAPRNVVGGVDRARNRARIARGGGSFVWLECARGSIAVTPCAHASHEGQVHTHSPPSRRHSASLNDSELARRRWFYEKNAKINLLLRPSAAPKNKKTKRRPSVHVLLNSTCTDGRQFSD